MSERLCDNCVNCIKGSDFWSCENYENSVGMPFKVSPPYNEACSNWSDDPEEKDKASDSLMDFVESYLGGWDA